MQTSEMLNGVSIGMQNALQTPNRSDNGIISALFNDQDKKENIRSSRYSRQNLFMEHRIIGMLEEAQVPTDGEQNTTVDATFVPDDTALGAALGATLGASHVNSCNENATLNALFYCKSVLPTQNNAKDIACSSRNSRQNLFMENRKTTMADVPQVQSEFQPNENGGDVASMQQSSMYPAGINVTQQALYMLVKSRNLNATQRQYLQNIVNSNTQ